MAAASAAVVNGVSQETRALVSELRRQFYTLGWTSGTGGSIAIKVHDDSIPKPQQLIVMSPSSGVQKERMVPEDMYVLSPSGSVLKVPFPKPYPHKPPKCSECASLFIKLGLNRSTPNYGPYHRVSGAERNTNIAVKAGTMNLNHSPEPSRRCIVLDIEGTTTPISFVMDALFPYARDNVGKHLTATYETEETQYDIKLLRAQIKDDLKQGVIGAVPIPLDDAGKEEIIRSLVSNVGAMIKADRKVTALKQLQGHIWRTGFQNNELKGVVFDDVPEALEKWHASGIKVYIYSSGSREAQRLIFGNSNYGDLRKYLCGFFDTTIGNKRESRSYFEISQSVGVDNPSEVLFITDVYQEAIAAKEAGLDVIISIRPGNGPLPENHGFKTVGSFLEI
ncbi:PREDICTED: probable bifunctional methylthioribulose-1-phosphate dehydratase/enolase-phosphatase E1 1 [Nelumbo nucifera]|uniref:Probable bifunctional methylthioribulose-1-phosphate dehydratase/enolase-phosphatase E1 1 n=1 Tax=Nelumbo nucifera TaxID=4432 RepID=A0A1U8ASE5_NELNU|nr:PREDICTED: probable bifunctional methylthioribulose-1-phosphate dehydratase/enolase-phosphatase E1 1 [Nelumbo nucifera]XP_010265719.1 PREDICTED: probable bifunctional methylthioribulose-1-phosphate dehydratase/enolase-phosphatase E1 1 [Nelumbo nucifera]